MKRIDEKRVVIVTGASSGIGRCAAELLASYGYSVYSFSRHGKSENGVIHISCDITDEEQVKNAVTKVTAEQGRIDILICSAGFGISGASETTSIALAKKQFDVNFFGTVSCVSAVLPQMRLQRNGRIVGISSLASIFPIPFQAFYSASKSALDSYMFALSNEVKPYGISICCVRPGDTKTGFTKAREKSAENGDYKDRTNRSIARMENDEQHGMSAEKVGKFVAEVAIKKRVKPYFIPGGGNKILGFLCKLLPNSLVRKIIGSMYSK
ncbi:MAG: SDR family oxidoreductase [Clostridia bacterium]|nr:SDR family oxidoreductase [Clostridia bacterium]